MGELRGRACGSEDLGGACVEAPTGAESCEYHAESHETMRKTIVTDMKSARLFRR